MRKNKNQWNHGSIREKQHRGEKDKNGSGIKDKLRSAEDGNAEKVSRKKRKGQTARDERELLRSLQSQDKKGNTEAQTQ